MGGVKSVVKKAYSNRNYKYLGKRVKDFKRTGLDSIKEYYAIKRKVIEDFEKGRIDEKTARGRLLLLYKLSFKDNNKKIADVPESSLKKFRESILDDMRKLDEMKK